MATPSLPPDGTPVAVRPCPVCGNPVAYDAVLCPACGTALNRRSGPDVAIVAAVVVAVAVAVLLAVLVARGGGDQTPAPATPTVVGAPATTAPATTAPAATAPGAGQ